MKGLKITLGAIYPILIILLLLSNCRGGACSRYGDEERTERGTGDVEPPVAEPADSSAMVEIAERTGMSGDLKITLLWDFPGDIDLHVMQPNGKEIYFKEKIDASTGGTLDIDNVDGGPGSAENVAWSNPPSGEYKVSLHYYQPSFHSNITGQGVCSVVIFQHGREPRTFRVPMKRVGDAMFVTKLNI